MCAPGVKEEKALKDKALKGRKRIIK